MKIAVLFFVYAYDRIKQNKKVHRMETKIKPIELSVKRSQFRLDDPKAEHSDSEFKELRNKIKKRDDYTCFYCNFRAFDFQEVHHINDNHTNNAETNLTTICPICHGCKHIGLSGLDEKGFLIYYPNISQVNLNIIIKTVWVGIESEDKDIKNHCQNIIDKFYELKDVADEKLTSDPATLSTLLLDMDEYEYKDRQKKLKNFILVPRIEAYKKQSRYWAKEVFKGTPSSEWLKIAKKIQKG
jgi:intracellular multiplication protein IcmJ